MERPSADDGWSEISSNDDEWVLVEAAGAEGEGAVEGDASSEAVADAAAAAEVPEAAEAAAAAEVPEAAEAAETAAGKDAEVAAATETAETAAVAEAAAGDDAAAGAEAAAVADAAAGDERSAARKKHYKTLRNWQRSVAWHIHLGRQAVEAAGGNFTDFDLGESMAEVSKLPPPKGLTKEDVEKTVRAVLDHGEGWRTASTGAASTGAASSWGSWRNRKRQRR